MLEEDDLQSRGKSLFALHLLLMLYSCIGICSKFASGYPMLSLQFCALYALLIVLLGVYAIGWQQMLKRLPLTTAYANKAVTILWGIVWGFLIFSEPVSIGKVIGGLFIIVGIVVFSYDDGRHQADGAAR